MGSIYGVTITSAIVQNLLAVGLPGALGPDASDEVRVQDFFAGGLSANSVVVAHRKIEKIPLCAA
jgi:hypothetical protein